MSYIVTVELAKELIKLDFGDLGHISMSLSYTDCKICDCLHSH